MKKVAVLLITAYQKVLSVDQGWLPFIFGKRKKVCIFYPTCSEYAKQAIAKYGVLKGVRIGSRRLLRCNPFNEPGVDLVP